MSISIPKGIPMTRTIQVTGARGGQGTSTIAASLAVLAAGHGPTLLCSDEPAITAALLGVSLPLTDDDVVEVAPNLDLATAAAGSVTPPGYNVIVIDAGRIPTGPFDSALGDWAAVDGAGPVEHYAVLRGPCYVGLATLNARYAGWVDGAIVVLEDGRALTERDVTDVLGVPVVATVPVEPAIARATDAGLLLSRLHRLSLRRLAALARPTDALTTTPMQNVTDLPGPLRGPNGAGRPCRDPALSVAVSGAWITPRHHRRAEHRAARARCGRLLRGRGRELGRGLLHRPR
jgi:hypothetical protein